MNKSEAINIMHNLQAMIVSHHKQDKETVFAIQMGIEALKAQEPRVITMHDWEVNHVAKIPVWVEWGKSAKSECADCEKADGWAVLNIDEFVDVLCFGGRCWTFRPTDEQRKR